MRKDYLAAMERQLVELRESLISQGIAYELLPHGGLAAVAREAGVADGTVYLYFRSKDELLSSIFTTGMDEFLIRVRAQLRDIDDPVQQLRQFARYHFECLERDRDMAIVFQIELRHSTKFMEQISTAQLADYFQIMREIIEEGQRRRMFTSQLSPKFIAKVLFGALDEMATNWVLSHNNLSLTATADPVIDLLLNGMREVHATE
jgi:TetR/AcrR family fatty acid metabolism transcriptional regulator